MKLQLGRIAEILSASGDFDREALVQGYSIDSRTVAPGQLFFAVKGEKLDGHDFVQDALSKGAVAAVVSRTQSFHFYQGEPQLIVDDTLLALQALARGVRSIWGKPLLGITGSAGKTTTKELIAQVLSRRFRVLKSEGNLNNHFGLPMQLLRLEPEDDIAVIEMGMSHAGEITTLARIAQPNLGVVTCVAPVHLGFFKCVAEIARAKQELVDELPPNGMVVLNADDEYVSKFGTDFAGRVVTFGIKNPADVRPQSLTQMGLSGSRFEVAAAGEEATIELRLIGKHNVYNALAAIAVGLQNGIALPEIAAALAEVTPVDKRGQILEIGGATVVNDCYNSNPRALESMISALAGMTIGPGGRRILVAGEMLELGPSGEELHRRCGQCAADRKIDLVVGVRGLAKSIVEAVPNAKGGTQALYVETPEAAGEWLAREVRPGDLVLLKGSRGVRLERTLETWKRLQEAAGTSIATDKEAASDYKR
jgi:UDP-N-acetylmuramoyl-tripeptide--D-alanyl-D-alanine ligase